MGELLLGFLLARLFGGGSPVARRPAEVFVPPVTPGLPPAPSSPGIIPTPPAPTFPAGVVVPPPPPVPTPAAPSPAPPPGFKKAVDVWMVKPSVVDTGTVVVGAGITSTPASVQALESNFPRAWQPVPQRSVTPAETAQAVALLKQWREGGIVFAGPLTFQGRRAFRMTKHPANAQPGAAPPAPVRPPAPAGPTVPASVQTPAAPAQGPPPFVPNRPLEESQRPPGLAAITVVRPNEGLANVAKRLGRPATAASATELRTANVPSGPDGVTWEAKKLDAPERGIKKKNRKGGLQPGDRLFVPTSWGPIDPSRL